jgi:taurine dioxygenase
MVRAGIGNAVELPIVRPLSGGLGARVTGMNITAPWSGLALDALQAALDKHALLVIKDQSLTRAELVAFSACFGTVVRHSVAEYLAPDHPEVMILSNNRENGRLVGAPNNGIYWHSDQIFRKRPVSLTLLYGHEVPPVAGDTLFADMRAIHSALPAELRARLQGMRAVHSFCASYEKNYLEAEPLTAVKREANPDVEHPAVRTHPRTGGRSIFLDPDSTIRIVGIPEAESAEILSLVFAYLDRSEFIYRHAWEPGDLVLWDNRCLMHRATFYDADQHRRVMWRTQLEGEDPV